MKKLLLIICSVIISNYSMAVGSTTTTNKATATLTASCQLNIANIALGNVSPGQASSTGTTDFNVLCTKATPYNFTVNFPTSDGSDCPFLLGAINNNKIYYGIRYGTTWIIQRLYTADIGTGTPTTHTIQAVLNPPASMGYYAGGTSQCVTPMTNLGFNPYVAPDNYVDTVTAEVNF